MKLVVHTCTCNSLTNFELKLHPITGNEIYKDRKTQYIAAEQEILKESPSRLHIKRPQFSQRVAFANDFRCIGEIKRVSFGGKSGLISPNENLMMGQKQLATVCDLFCTSDVGTEN